MSFFLTDPFYKTDCHLNSRPKSQQNHLRKTDRYSLKMRYKSILVFSILIFTSWAKSNDFNQLANRYCQLKSSTHNSNCTQNTAISAETELQKSMFLTIEPLCEQNQTELRCSEFADEFKSLNLIPLSCSADQFCHDIVDLNQATTKCLIGAGEKTFDAFLNLLQLPLSIINFTEKSFKNDSDCYSNHELKIAPVLAFNLLAPAELRIDEVFIKKDTNGKLIGAMKDWPCTEINRLVFQKQKKLNEYLAKNNLRSNSVKNEGVLQYFQRKLSCMSHKSKTLYACEIVTSLAANTVAGLSFSQLLQKIYYVPKQTPKNPKASNVEIAHLNNFDQISKNIHTQLKDLIQKESPEMLKNNPSLISTTEEMLRHTLQNTVQHGARSLNFKNKNLDPIDNAQTKISHTVSSDKDFYYVEISNEQIKAFPKSLEREFKAGDKIKIKDNERKGFSGRGVGIQQHIQQTLDELPKGSSVTWTSTGQWVTFVLKIKKSN